MHRREAAQRAQQGGTARARTTLSPCPLQPEGLTAADVASIIEVKASHNGTLEEVAKKLEGVTYVGDRCEARM